MLQPRHIHSVSHSRNTVLPRRTPRSFPLLRLRRTISAYADPSHPAYNPANEEWTNLTFDHPLVHTQTGMKVYLVGVHHNSPASLRRVEEVIRTVRPKFVCLELDEQRRGAFEVKGNILLGQGDTDQPLELTGGTSSTSSSPLRESWIRTSTGAQIPSPVQLHRTTLPQTLTSNHGYIHVPAQTQTIRSVAPPQSLDMLSEDSRLALLRLGIDPTLHFSSHYRTYGLEIGTALQSAKKYGALIRLIDFLPTTASPDFLSDLRGKYRIKTHVPRRTSKFGQFLFKWLSRAAYWGDPSQPFWKRYSLSRDIAKETEMDITTVRDLALFLRIWQLFHPSPYHYSIELRNAGMVDQLRKCIWDLAEISGLRGGEPNPYESIEEREERERAMEEGTWDPPCVVAVVGKSHVFGMAEMWDKVVKEEKIEGLRKGRVRRLLQGVEVGSLEELKDRMGVPRFALPWPEVEKGRGGKKDEGLVGSGQEGLVLREDEGGMVQGEVVVEKQKIKLPVMPRRPNPTFGPPRKKSKGIQYVD